MSTLQHGFRRKGLFALGAAGLFALGMAGPAYAEQEYEVDDKDSSATPFGNTCFTSTFRILYQGDDYTACEGGGAFSGVLFNLGNGPRAAGQPPFRYDNSGNHCVYAKWADGAARWTSVRYEVDWSSTGSFAPNNTYIVNQQRDGGQWVRLGCSTLPTAGQFPIVRCSTNGIPGGRFAICDGIRVVRENVDGGDIIDNTVSSVDILNNTITSTDVRNDSLTRSDMRDEPGVEWQARTSRASSGISTSCSSRTNVQAISVTPPEPYGYVVVTASGTVFSSVADQWVQLVIGDASGGSESDTWNHYLGNNGTGSTFVDRYEEFSFQVVYPITSTATRSFYLKACRQSGYSGTLYPEAFTAVYVPSRY